MTQGLNAQAALLSMALGFFARAPDPVSVEVRGLCWRGWGVGWGC